MKISKAAKKLAKDLGLSEIDAAIMELKSKLYERCSHAIQNSNLTHEQIASEMGTSRARITRISNMGENSVSLELLIKISAVLEEKLPIKVAWEEMNQVEFAEFLGISKQRLCDIEKNRTTVGLKLSKEIAEKLDLPPEWLAEYALQDQINYL